MSISSLVEAAAAGPLDRGMIERACADEKMKLFTLYDAFASHVAAKFLSGDYSWPFSDAAMNSLFTYAHPVSLSGLPPFAFEINSAFDEGEYQPEGESLSHRLVAQALRNQAPNKSPEPTPTSVMQAAKQPSRRP